MTQRKYTTQEQIEAMREEILREKQKMMGIATDKSLSGRLSRRRRILGITGRVLLSAMIVLLVWSIISIQLTRGRGDIPNILGFQLFAIESGSMEPTLKIGAVIVSRIPKEAEPLDVNDIITFRTLSGAVVTHRIIEVVREGDDTTAYRTKGDNPKNSADQELLTRDRVIGVFVARIPLT